MNFKGIEYNGIKFKLRDVPGDGNCLYHSIVCSNVIQRTSAQLRSETYKCVLEIWRGGCDFVDALYESYGKLIPIVQYTSEQKENGKWGSTLDMCFVSIVFGVNIVSVSNTTGGLNHFSVFDYFCAFDITCNYILDGAPTIWLFHHLHKQPFVPSLVLNNFCSLWPVDNLPDPVYRGRLDHNKRKIDNDNEMTTNPRKKSKGSDPSTDSKMGSIFCHFEVLVCSTSNKSGSRRKNIQKATTTKATKQLTCHNWLKTMKQNNKVMKKFDKALSFSKEMENKRRIMLKMQD